jgi:hypothetical protein
MAPKEKELEPVKDRKVVERYLRYASEFRELASCLADKESFRFEGQIRSFKPGALSVDLEISMESFQSLTREELARLDTPPSEVRFSFSVNDVLFFAHARVLERKTRSLSLGVDLPVFKLQRRDAMRIKVLEEHNASITIEGKSYIPHDLSATGLSFVVMLDEEALFPLRRIIQSCRLHFAGLDVPVNLEVMSVSRLRKEDGHLLKVGFRFLGLSPATEQKLAREAYLHTHKIWSRWL